MIANADVVFDETLRRMPSMQAGRDAQIISVIPPSYSGDFKDMFGKPCGGEYPVKNRCQHGEDGSWDVFAFQPPLPSAFPISQLEFAMNSNSAENRAASAMESVGFRLKNPCKHIHAYHWHCFAAKTHSNYLAQ